MDGRLKDVMLALVLGLCLGCGEKPVKPAGEQATVSGTVVIDGRPIPADSEVVFFNKDANATLGAKVDSLGKFSLAAADPKIGIPVGRYQVAVRPAPPPPVEMGTAEYQKRMMEGTAASEPPATTSPIPVKFNNFETSNLVFQVKAGANDFPIDLSKL